MIMQPNSGREVMITFKMVLSIVCTDAIVCIYFVDGVVTTHRVDLDYIEE